MEEKIKAFLEGPGKEITDYLGPGGDVRITLGDSSYRVKMDEDRELQVEKGEEGNSDIEIKTEEEIMNDLLSSSSMEEYRQKMASYTFNDKKPAVKIHMERTDKNAARFIRTYVYFLRRMWLLN
jgi:hypothetical protein